MSEPETDDDTEEQSQDSPGPRLSVWAPILLTAVAIGGLVWWIQSGDDTIDRRRATADAPSVTTEITLPTTAASDAAAPTAEVAIAPPPPSAEAPETAPAVTPEVATAPPEASTEPASTEPASADPAAAATGEAPEPTVELALAPPAEAPVAAAPPTEAPAAEAPAVDATPPAAPVTIAAAPSASVDAGGQPTVASPSTGLPTAAVSDVPTATRIDGGAIESARVSAPPPALPTRPAPEPAPIASLTSEAPTEAAASVSARSGPPAEPMPTVPASAPAEIADGPPALPVETGVAVLPVHRMPVVQPSEASDDIETTEVAAGAGTVTKPAAVVAAETVAPVTIEQGAAAPATASVSGPQPPIGTIDPAAPVMAEASKATNTGSAPAAPPTEINPGSPNVGDAKATDAGVIVAETLDPATLGIIVPPDSLDGATAAAGPAEQPDAAAPAPAAGGTGSGAIVAEEVDPASLGLTIDDADAAAATAPPDGAAPTVEPPVLAALPPEETTTAVVAETLDLSALEDPASPPAAEVSPPAEETAAAAAPPAAPESGAGALPMVATVAAIAPPRPAWQRFATTVVEPVGGHPTVSVIVEGLGQSASRTRTAIDTLPQAVALAFDPYAPAVAEFAAAAQAAGHEVLITLPMEAATEGADAGPQAMGLGLSAEENADRLGWALDRARGYVGVLTPTDAELPGDAEGMAPIVASLRRQGLMVVTGGSDAAADAFPADLPQAAVDQRVALPDDTGRYDAVLARAEEAARDAGHVVLMVSPYPAAMQQVAAWLATLPGKGLALAPITATAGGRQASAGP